MLSMEYVNVDIVEKLRRESTTDFVFVNSATPLPSMQSSERDERQNLDEFKVDSVETLRSRSPLSDSPPLDSIVQVGDGTNDNIHEDNLHPDDWHSV